ncbi:hypothetical protein M3Y97_00909700 [Aphelenchoides bicaudatus]|nr:hypothetical protein M3Y97_00909700 [Aphelenchoides bicaudatus]
MGGQNGVSEDKQSLINHGESTSASSKSGSKQNSECDRIQQQVEVHLDMEPETVASRSESLNFDSKTGEIFANGINEIHELGSDDHLEDNFHIDNLKLFENLEQTFSTTTVQEPPQKNCFYSTSIPSCSFSNNEYNKSSCWIPSNDANSFVKCTGYVLSPPMANPVDMVVDGDFLAIADYDNGIHFVNNKECARRHFNTDPFRICGVQFWHDERDTRHVIMLAYVTESEKWTINVHSWPDFEEELIFECPAQPSVPTWARRKITLVDGLLYLLATSEQCSAIWTLQMSSSIWKTLIVERGRPQSTIGFNFANSLLPNQLVDKQTIKVKRRKNEKWIVQGPKLAVWDSERDIIVYDGSGKIFWFDGQNYRIRKIVGDIGRSEEDANFYRYQLLGSLMAENLRQSQNPQHNKIKTFVHTYSAGYNRIDFVKSESPHKIHKLNCDTKHDEHALTTRKVIKELTHDPVTNYYYAITEDDTIDIRVGEFITLVTKSYAHSWANQLSSLQLDPLRGRMFWIWQKSQSVVKAAGMDGKNVRDVYTGTWIYSISLDIEENMLYIAEVDYVTKLNLTSLESEKFLNVQADKIVNFNCNLYFIERNERTLQDHKDSTTDLKIARIEGTLLPFYIGTDDEKSNYTNPCSNFTCEHFCILGEGPSKAIPVCFCPHCEQSLLENHWFLAFAISCCMLSILLLCYCFEIKCNCASKLCGVTDSFGSEFISTEPSVMFRKSSNTKEQ